MTEAEILERLKGYQFYHTVQITDRVATTGNPGVRPIVELTRRNLRTLDLKDKRVLDIGCRDGLFSFEAEKQGAAEVIGIDNDPSPGAVELLIPALRSRVRLYEMNLLDLRPETFGTFDTVICPGVLYHLRYPFSALKIIHDVLNDGGNLLLETAVYADDNEHALLFCPVGSETPYAPDSTCCTFFNVKGLTDTLASFGLVVHKVDFMNERYQPNRARGVRHMLRSLLPGSSPKQPVVIQRAAFLCEKKPQGLHTAAGFYWNGKHGFHSGRVIGLEDAGVN
jgi:2-polyprenyl-3-methyl-5-hydroxy-6-metoxy-1,4-benzoquinol methylase